MLKQGTHGESFTNVHEHEQQHEEYSMLKEQRRYWLYGYILW